jgi:hypothetical protein
MIKRVKYRKGFTGMSQGEVSSMPPRCLSPPAGAPGDGLSIRPVPGMQQVTRVINQ